MLAVTNLDLESAFAAYVECALWSSTDDDGIPLDRNYSTDDIDPATLERMRSDVSQFVRNCDADLCLWDQGDAYAQATQAGHDFWLTRNGHGCGFWEQEWTDLPTNPGERLDRAAKAFGSFDLYVGDDGKIHGFHG